MGKELTPAQMREILARKANRVGKKNLRQWTDLVAVADGIDSDLMGGNGGHARFFLKNPQELIETEVRYRELFRELTGIDSKDADLSAEDGGFEAK